jgi:hypothetical protein
MSAINVIFHPTLIHVVTDGAAVFRHRLAHLQAKVLPVPHLGVVVSCRGQRPVANRLLFQTSMYRSVADMRSSLPGDLRRSFGVVARLLPSLFRFDLIVAGYDGGEPFAFLVSNVGHPGTAPYEILEIETTLATPMIDEQILADADARSRRDQAGSFENLDAAARAIVDAQRSSGVVGGFVQITSVGARGIFTRIVKRYADEVGKALEAS